MMAKKLVVAIDGPAGAGKSTVLQLVERFYDVDGGAIRVFGKDIRDYSREDLRRHLGYVEQDSPVLSGTLRQNLTLGTPDADDSSCLQALAMVKLDYLASRSPKGLDAVVGESGAGLSGGERQRAAIAVALYHDPDIVLADEPTAALDTRRARDVARLLADQTHELGKAAVMVTHDERLLPVCDRVLVMHDGVLAPR